MTFYLDNFMPGTADTPSIVEITLPSNNVFKGLLSNEVTIQLSNKFGALLPGGEMLSDLAQAAGATNIPAWIGASAQGWRGTDPVKFNLEVFLVNYKPRLNYEERLRELAKLATISPGKGMWGGASHLTATVHGGYSPDVFASNKYQFISKDDVSLLSEDGNNLTKKEKFEDMRSLGGIIAQGVSDYTGTIKVKIGSNFSLNNLLLNNINITPSVVEVYSPSAGESPKPLYYRVSMGIITCRAALSTDVEKMFG